MVGRNAVAEDEKRAGAGNRGGLFGFLRHFGEERRLLDVSTVGVPVEKFAFFGRNRVPKRIRVVNAAIVGRVNFAVERVFGDGVDFFVRRENVGEHNRRAVLVDAERFRRHVDIRRSGQRERDDERRAGEVIRLNQRVDAAFEVAVPAQNGGRDQVAVDDRLRDRFRKRAAVPDAGEAAVSDDVEAERFERRHQVGLFQVVDDDAGARAEARFDVRFRTQTAFDRFLREETGGDHQARRARVRAAGDRRDNDGALADFVDAGFRETRRFRAVGAVPNDANLFVRFLFGEGETAFGNRRAERFLERRLHFAKRNAVLRTFRPGQRRFDGREVEGKDFRVIRRRRVGAAEEALRFRVGFDERDRFGVATGFAEEVERFFVDREEAGRRAVFRAHIRQNGAVGDRKTRRAVAEVFDELPDDALFAEDLNDRQREVGAGNARFEGAFQLEPDDLRREHIIRLAEHDRFRFDPADAPTENAEAVDHHRMAVGADDGVREDETVEPRRFRFVVRDGRRDASEEFKVDLVNDPDGRRNGVEVVERTLRPAEEGIAFGVPFEFAVDVLLERIGGTEVVGLNRVVDDEIDRNERVDFFRVAAETLHRGAHRGQVDDRRDAGEVLQDDAGRFERHFERTEIVRRPTRQIFDVGFGNREFVAVAQRRFEQNANRVRERGEFGQPAFFQRGETIIAVFFTADVQNVERLKIIASRKRVGHALNLS